MSTFPPTDEQSAIIDFARTNPNTSLMIDARAGAGKTDTICRVAQVVTTRPALAIAFNKRIAEELATRLPGDFETMTLNGAGHRAWMRSIGKRVELDTDKMFKLTKQLLNKPDAKKFGDDQDDLFIETLALARRAKSKGIVPRGAPMGKQGILPDDDAVWEDIAFEAGFELSPDALAAARGVLKTSISMAYQGVIDFDDQIYMSVLFGGVYNKFHTVFVDETQDLSPLNHEQLVRMVGTRLIAVGDPYQAIYAFRGADNNSMTSLMDRFQFTRLGLTQSFRCPHEVSSRQTAWVPDYRSFATCKPGRIERWPKRTALQTIRPSGGEAGSTFGDEDLVADPTWSLRDLPREGFVLCRNNAPLMKLAFALIKARRPVKILGRDIGASLANLLTKICGKGLVPIDQAPNMIEDWYHGESQKLMAKGQESRVDTLYDRKECLLVLCEASGCETTMQAVNFIRELFADKAEGLVLSSGHRAKGLESNWVMHLDPWRVPSRQAQKAEDRGDAGPMMQEKNLRYVIETRTKDVLVMANLEDCEEVGE